LFNADVQTDIRKLVTDFRNFPNMRFITCAVSKDDLAWTGLMCLMVVDSSWLLSTLKPTSINWEDVLYFLRNSHHLKVSPPQNYSVYIIRTLVSDTRNRGVGITIKLCNLQPVERDSIPSRYKTFFYPSGCSDWLFSSSSLLFNISLRRPM
jgi:hypothetical protein